MASKTILETKTRSIRVRTTCTTSPHYGKMRDILSVSIDSLRFQLNK